MRTRYSFYPLSDRLAAYILFLLGTWLLTSCQDECTGTYTYKVFEPVYLSRTDLVQAIGVQPAKPLRNTGKIYAIDQYILVNEQHEGIHVIDNQNPQAPQNIGFISIPGNVDMAVRNKVLYADAATDLLVLDFSNPAAVKLVKHLENVFEPHHAFNGNGTWVNVDNSKGLVIDYKERVITETRRCDEVPVNGGGGSWFANDGRAQNASKSNSGGSTGTGGSMARFTIVDNYLYTVGTSSLNIFNLSSPTNPQPGQALSVGSGIETIFPYQDKLFIGSNAGMFIYSLANPAQPAYLGGYSHLRACDPVVVEGNYAYVTLRTNPSGRCGPTNANQLDVVDISNPAAPRVHKTYPMQNPHGLGIANGTLFICEGNYGLKVFNAANPDKISENQLSHLKDLHAFDVIPLGQNLLVIGEDGFRQYDYSDPSKLKFLSQIPVVKP